jgi:RNA polymerase sigma-70 factor (ECF subfamily)
MVPSEGKRLGSPDNSVDPHEQREKLAENDRELVEAVLRKDRKASAELVSSHADHVYSYVRHRLIPRADLVEDVVQEVFLAAWENLGRYQGSAPLRHWLIGIARHKVEDYYRARLREPEPMDDQPDPPETAEDPGLEEIMDREQKETRIHRVLSDMPEAYSLALLWRYWERRSAREIAQQTDRTEKAVERLLARARAEFKRRWKQ